MENHTRHVPAFAGRLRLSHRVWICLLALTLTKVAFTTSAWAAIGRTPGTAGVTPHGEASYVIAIRNTPGTAGLAPELAISYAGASVRGVLGIGFSIAGLSAITPCARTVAQDGASAPITLTTSDQYCVDGQRLRLVSGAYGGNNAQYRTEIDLAMRVTSYAAAGKQPTWFRIERANGLIYEYGNTATSRARSSASANAVTFVWALSKVSDRSGNTITFAYENDPAARLFRPDYIDYAGTPATGAGDYRIDFVYQGQERPDPVEQSTPSSSEVASIDEDRLLARVDLQRLGATYRQYLFSYQTGAGSNSQLVAVQECAVTTSDCLAATTITWQAATPGFSTAIASSATVALPAYPLDLNGDGYDDLVWAQGGSWRTMFGSSGGYGLPNDSGVAATNPARALPLEWDGDGRMDLLVDWSDGKWRVLKGASSGLATPVPAGAGGIASNIAASSWTVADLDADGRDDLVRASTSPRVFNARLNSSTGFSGEFALTLNRLLAPAANAFVQNLQGSSAHRRIDFDGDGREDIVVQGCEWDMEVNRCPFTTEWWVFHSNGTGLQVLGPLAQSRIGDVPVFGDFNSDRLTDVAYSRADGRIGIALSRGRTGFTHVAGPVTNGYVSAQLRVADYDDDGYDDLLMARNPSAGVYWWHVFRGNGAGVATAAIATSIPGLDTLVTDVNGDGLNDLARPAPSSNAWSYYPRNGLPGGELASVTDGFGVRASWSRAPMSSSQVYTRGSGATYPMTELGGSRPLVRQLTQSDGTGSSGTYTLTYRYEAARGHQQGRGFLGFGKRVVEDDRLGRDLRTEQTFLQSFPHVGLPAVSTLRSSNGTKIVELANTWSSINTGTAQLNERRLPYLGTSTARQFTLGGASAGLLYRSSSTVASAVDPNSGLVVDRTTTVTEHATGLANGTYRSVRTLHSGVLNDATNWCLGKPQTTQITASHTDSGGAPIARSYVQSWDGTKCRLTQRQLQPGDPKLQQTTTFGYDAFGNLATESVTGVGMAARTTTIGWGTRGQFPEKVTNALGQVTTLTWQYVLGALATIRDPNALATTWSYDSFGRPLTETRPDQTSTAWARSACSGGCDSRSRYRLIRSERNTKGAVYRTETSDVDRFERAFSVAADMPGGGDSITTVDFDANGAVVARHLPYTLGGVPSGEWRYAYDALGRPTAEELRTPAGSIRYATAYEYDGLRTVRTDPMGYETASIANAWGEPVRMTDALGRNTNYEYNAFGQLTRVVNSAGTQVASVTYDARGQKTGQSDADLGSWTFDVNALGEVVRVRDARTAAPNWTTTLAYDALSRVVSRRDELEAVTGTYVYGTTAASRNVGRLQSVSASDGSYAESYTYDGVGRLSRRRIVADATYDFDFSYNTYGLLQMLQYPASTAGYRLNVGYEYTNGFLTRIVDPATDPDAEIWRMTTMDASGRVLDESLGSSIQVVTGFDPETGRVTDRIAGAGGSTALQDHEYSWDANGNLTRRVDHNQAGLSETFAYDSLNRIDRAWRNGTLSLDVAYDDIGNITSKFEEGVGTLNYSYDPIKKHAVTAAGTNTYAYDANGNMRTRNGATTSWYSYNLPRSIARAGGNSSQFSYGPDRNRWKQVANVAGTTETTIYVGGLMEKLTRAGATTYRHYIEAPGATAAVYLRHSAGSPGTATYYLTHDHVGSTDKIIAAAGTTVAVAESFSAFGRRRGKTWSGVPTASELATISAVTRDGFTGHESLDNLNLIHMNGRVYDPLIGRFLSADPYVQAPYNPQSLNRYSYVWNNPLSLVDPSGFSAADGDRPSLLCDDGCVAWYFASFRYGWVPSAINAPTGPFPVATPGSTGVPAASPFVPSEPRQPPPLWYALGLAVDAPPLSWALSSIDWLGEENTVRFCGATCARAWDGDPNSRFAPKENSATNAERILNSVGAGTMMLPFVKLGALRHAEALTTAISGTENVSEAFHYTFNRVLASIQRQGLRPGSYVTTNGRLTPMQAQIDLALAPNRGLRNALIRVDLDGLREAGFRIPEATRVSRGAGMPGGGFEMQFPYAIPPEFLKMVGP